MRWVWLLAIGYWLLATPVYSAGEFYIKQAVEYRFNEQGNSAVEHNISLTNQLSRVYATQYQLTLQGETPSHITAFDAQGPLKITTGQTSSDSTLVTVTFNDQVLGKGKTLNFTLSYQGRPANHNGQVWEVSLPRLGNPQQVDQYQLALVVPPSFGQPAFISPTPATTDGSRFTFSKDQVARIGVVAAFGRLQTFGFTLKYHLDNPSPTTLATTIALPPDTNYQRLVYASVSPPPEGVTIDSDGNWLASYRLAASRSLTVVATGQAHLLSQPTQPLIEPTPEQLATYLRPAPYWPVDDPAIESLARKLLTPAAIYDYVVQTLDYDYGAARPGVRRQGAKGALANPQSSICTEFTDLFVTLARAAGIPARELNGYAYTTDPKLKPLSLVADVLHAWPEYWDSARRTWISVDPTWGKTSGGVDYFNKLDFNHFVFAIHGVSDSQPLAAGLYKVDSSRGDVQVNFAPYGEQPSAALNLSWKPPAQVLPFVPATSNLTLTNSSGVAVYRVAVEVTSQNLKLFSPASVIIAAIGPYSQVSLPITVVAPNLFNFRPKALTISSTNQTLTYNIPVSTFLFWHGGLTILLAVTILAAGFSAHQAWGVYLQRRHRSDSLRG